MSSLSHAQFARLPGGSRRLSDRTVGPDSGYYVSRDPEKKVSEGGSLERIAKAQSESAVGRHYRAVRESALSAPAPKGSTDVYQGIWTSSPADESDRKPRTYLDVSDHYTDPMTAGHAAIQNRQKGMYSASTESTIPVWNEDRTKWSAAGINDEVKRVIKSL